MVAVGSSQTGTVEKVAWIAAGAVLVWLAGATALVRPRYSCLPRGPSARILRGMISTVAVGTDGSETAGTAVAAAMDLAERFGATLLVLSAYTRQPRGSGAPRLGSSASPDLQWASNEAEHVERILAVAEESATARGVECRSAMAEGDAGEVLVSLAERHGADLLVVGNKGMHRRVLGSVPDTVTHRAACSVFVVKTA